jgi:hypothetical protein
MKGGSILLIIGLLLGYLAVSGKYKCISFFVQCIISGPAGCSCGTTTASAQDSGNPQVPEPKTYKAPAYEGLGAVSYNLADTIEAFA